MSYTLRKVERYTNWEATKPVTLNPEDFKTLSFPFEGETEQEFAQYIHDMYYEDWYELADELEEQGKMEAADALAILFEGDMEVYSSTTDKEEVAWIDSGEVDPEYTKWGGFKVNCHTADF